MLSRACRFYDIQIFLHIQQYTLRNLDTCDIRKAVIYMRSAIICLQAICSLWNDFFSCSAQNTLVHTILCYFTKLGALFSLPFYPPNLRERTVSNLSLRVSSFSGSVKRFQTCVIISYKVWYRYCFDQHQRR